MLSYKTYKTAQLQAFCLQPESAKRYKSAYNSALLLLTDTLPETARRVKVYCVGLLNTIIIVLWYCGRSVYKTWLASVSVRS